MSDSSSLMANLRLIDTLWAAPIAFYAVKMLYEQARKRNGENGHAHGKNDISARVLAMETEVARVRERLHDLAGDLNVQVTKTAVVEQRVSGMADSVRRIEDSIERLHEKFDRMGGR